MTDPTTPADDAALQRRRFLRGGALAAAAAAGGVLATGAGSAVPAAAESGDPLLIGRDNLAGTDTSLRVDAAAVTTLKLLNNDGPALELPREGGYFPMRVNQLAGSDFGPMVAVRYPGSDVVYTDWVATSSEVSSVPVTYPVENQRLLDTRRPSSHSSIVNRSSKALDSEGRLRKGAWIDVAVVGGDEDYRAVGAFVVLTSRGSSKDGSLTAYIPDYDRNGTVSVSFLKGKTMSGSTYVGLNAVKGKQAFRLYASQTTHVAVDLTGVTEVSEAVFTGAQGRSVQAGPRKAPRRDVSSLAR
jgi:hypothetical protein